MNHGDAEGTDILFTERCNLVPLSAAHHEHIFALYRNQDVQQYLGGVVEDESAFCSRYAEILNDKNATNWAVFLHDSDNFVGMISLNIHHDKQDYEVGFKFSPDFWSQGYAFETLVAAIEDKRARLSLSSIVAETQRDNSRCRTLLVKLGFNAERELMRYGEKQILYRATFSN